MLKGGKVCGCVGTVKIWHGWHGGVVIGWGQLLGHTGRFGWGGPVESKKQKLLIIYNLMSSIKFTIRTRARQ